jgi:diguanylate cyclase (GGDEF)-like protein
MMESDDTPRLSRQSDAQLRRLMEYYLRAYSVAATEEHAEQFLRVYHCFMWAVPPGERDAKRLDWFVRAAFGIPDSAPGPRADEETQVTAGLAALTPRFSEEQALRQEEEALHRQLQEELLKVEGTVSVLYGDLVDHLDRQQRVLAEREAQIVRRERETQTRLEAVVALESRLQTALERRLHTEAHSLLDERVTALVEELTAIRSELAEFAAEESVAAGSSVPPLLSVMRSLKGVAQAAGIDPLTGLRNRDRFEAELAQSLERFWQALGAGDPAAENVALLYFDIDDFQGINERHGRSVGDAALQQVARVLKTIRRGSDQAYRFDGSKMIVLLPRTAVSGARNVAEILRRQIVDAPVETSHGEPVPLTVSVGGCDALIGDAAIVTCAGHALQRACEEGGDRTVIFSDDESLASLADVVPAEFATVVRDRLVRRDGFSVVAVRTAAPDRLPELQGRIAEKFSDHLAHGQGVLYLLVDVADAKIALRAVEEAIEGIPARAVAADVGEAPPATDASPGTRVRALLTQLIEMLA